MTLDTRIDSVLAEVAEGPISISMPALGDDENEMDVRVIRRRKRIEDQHEGYVVQLQTGYLDIADARELRDLVEEWAVNKEARLEAASITFRGQRDAGWM